MAEKQSIYACPHCGKKSFNPITKAIAGGMNTKGRVCKECGRRAVNGVASTIFRSVVLLIAVIIVFVIYFKGTSNWDYAAMAGVVIAAWLVSLLFDAFFCPLIKVIRNDV